MDNIRMNLQGTQWAQPANIAGDTAPVNGEIKETGNKTGAREPEVPVDHLELSREERVNISLKIHEMNMCKLAQAASLTLVGEAIGSAVAFSITPAIPVVAAGAALGAAVGFILERTGYDKPIAKAVRKGLDIALTPFNFAAKHIKNTAKKALSLVIKQKEKNEGAAQNTGTGTTGSGTSVSGTPGADGIIADKTAAGIQESAGGKQEKKTLLDYISTGLGTIPKIWRSLPKFIYPSIKNATAAEKELITGVLDSLPLKDVTSSNSVAMSSTLAESAGASGMAWPLMYDNPILFDKGELAMDEWGREVVRHEFGHTRDFSEAVVPGTGPSLRKPFGTKPGITDYAETSRAEDFAESHAYFHDPKKAAELKAKLPDKYAALENLEKPGIYDKIMDRSGVRKVGKKVAEYIDKVPHLRTLLAVTSYILGPLSIHNGTDTLVDGIKEGNLHKEFTGKMKTAQGLSYLTHFFAPMGLSLWLAESVIKRRVKNGKMTPEQAKEFSNKALAFSAGPVGMTLLAASRSLVKTKEGDKVRQFLFQERKPVKLSEKIGSKFGKTYYDVINPETGHKVDLDKTRLTWSDRGFVAKVAGGTITGGIIGGLGGFLSGKVIGGAIGTAVAGPFGAICGTFLGEVLGTLIGNYKGAQVGAQMGRFADKTIRERDLPGLKQKISDHMSEVSNIMQHMQPMMTYIDAQQQSYAEQEHEYFMQKSKESLNGKK